MLSESSVGPRKGSQLKNKHRYQPGTYFGMLIMFSARDGMPIAFINDGFLQHMRVAGGAGLGVKYLARPHSHVIGIIGSCGMVRSYLSVPGGAQITKVKVYSPSQGNAKCLSQGNE